MHRWVQGRNLGVVLTALFLVVLGFQACGTGPQFMGMATRASMSSSGQGNGDSYGGKPTIYSQFDPARVCSEKGADGRALPTAQIFRLSDLRTQLVRKDCTDLDVPLEIARSELTYLPDGSGNIVYRGEVYQLQTTGTEFGVVAATCPTGSSPIVGATRTNLVLSSQDLTDTSVWFNHDGIATALDGALGSLFRYEIRRNDPALLDFWRRIHQSDFPLAVGKTYSYSFLAQPGTVNEAWFSVRSSVGYELSLVIDLTTGQVTEQRRQNIPSYSTVQKPVGKGRFVTVYFETPGGGTSTVIGITPNGTMSRTPALGDSIYATAIQMEDVSTFCQTP